MYFRWIVVVLLTPISAFTLGVVYNSFKLNQFEWGNVSDWVSSTANVVMAGAALYAAWNAKDFFRSKRYDIGFSTARELVIHFKSMDEKLIHIGTLTQLFSVSSTVKSDIESIYVLAKQLDSDLKKSEVFIKDLKMLGWSIKTNYSEIEYIYSSFSLDSLIPSIELNIFLYEKDDEDNKKYHEDTILQEVRDIGEYFKSAEEKIDYFLNQNLIYNEYFDIEN
ncbi:hypothetical protein L0Y26_09305 [Pectobacterium aroidearum]|uniref:hypothetical protein n=1 Tax=Pectobacterium aroidearum TaxID=1201031 RepID=UPI002115B3AC|nr:hypothetical protein [Pectobacterium aroidearum]UUE38088.1 hypothetical protein L0Y26_09305 [Pectobacterium aroidearum]UUE42463.1 hypothetical protein L0Y25_09305 [Pectobacterium aroidearum]